MEVTTNKLRDPNAIKWIFVKNKETGNMLALEKQQDFNPVLHERIALEAKPEVKVEAPTDRFAELKAIGWVNLNKAQKVEYKALKPE